MKHAAAALLLPLLAACAAAPADAPAAVPASAPVDLDDHQPAAPQDAHAWLQRFVGDWTARAEASMGPDQPPMIMESTESVRRVGDLWIVAEGSSEFEGQPFHSVLTLGWDPQAEAFVGTWIDSMQPTLWIYRGWLDDAGRVLTLEAEGPAWEDPSQTALYRDAVEFVTPDHRVLRSTVQGPDGEWTHYLTAEYHRKR